MRHVIYVIYVFVLLLLCCFVVVEAQKTTQSGLLKNTGDDGDDAVRTGSVRRVAIPAEPGEGVRKCAHIDDVYRVPIVYSTDVRGVRQLVASIQSALRSAEEPTKLIFNVLIATSDAAELEQTCSAVMRRQRAVPSLFCSVPSRLPACAAHDVNHGPCACAGNDRFRLMPIPASVTNAAETAITRLKLSSDVHQAVSVLDRPELLSVANFARNELHELMASAPELNVTRVIYLDTDTIVARDIAELYSHASALMDARVHASEQHHDEEEGEEQHARRTNGSGRREVVMVAVRSCERRMDYFYNFDAADSIRATMNATDCYINAGVYVMDLDRYRVLGIADTIASLQEAHVRSGAHSGGLWREGTHQPSFILALYNYTATDGIDPRWNVSGLGWNSTKTHRELAQAFILHWTGHRKPWRAGGLYSDVWHSLSQLPRALHQTRHRTRGR